MCKSHAGKQMVILLKTWSFYSQKNPIILARIVKKALKKGMIVVSCSIRGEEKLY